MKEGSGMSKIIRDPDFEEFDGRYVDNTIIAPPNNYDFSRILRYMNENGKKFEELSEKEIEQFRFRD